MIFERVVMSIIQKFAYPIYICLFNFTFFFQSVLDAIKFRDESYIETFYQILSVTVIFLHL